ncbi:hypothetical protein K435DRAFT_767930 [Dendrothele bispora CBS 962.96]|uniref:F-box domain-containing protein n=1 Tax=Dendrothele bispora (strain CBS 962.96) TaxID=1314807 RepID=A0A4S8KX55_DENBC|nr:hypothetical protein K435DRAFT_767930 [Dendrothele bispora CBS 962.96]
MTMTSLNDLATEILLIVLNKVPSTKDLMNLRLVSRHLDSVTGPALFHSLALDIRETSIQQGTSLIQYLAENPEAPIAGWVRILVIANLNPSYNGHMSGILKGKPKDVIDVKTQIFNHLERAIQALGNVIDVQWILTSREPKWTHTIIPKALSTLPNLSSLSLNMFHATLSNPLPFDNLSGLRFLSVRSSFSRIENMWRNILDPLVTATRNSQGQLEKLHLDIYAGKEIVQLGELLRKWNHIPNEGVESSRIPGSSSDRSSSLGIRHLILGRANASLSSDVLPHLRLLTNVEMREQTTDHIPIDPSLSNDFFSTLRLATYPIHLSKISIYTVDKTLLDYLVSYSGLESFKVSSCPSPERVTARTSGLVADGYDANRLARLFYRSVLPNHSQSLTELELTVSKESAWSFCWEHVDKFRMCTKLQRLVVGINPNEIGNVGEKEDIVTTLLTTTLMLQDLYFLSILITQSNSGERSTLSSAAITNKHVLQTKLYEIVGQTRHRVRVNGDIFTILDLQRGASTQTTMLPRYARRVQCPGHIFDFVKTMCTMEMADSRESSNANEQGNDKDDEVEILEFSYKEILSPVRSTNYSMIL